MNPGDALTVGQHSRWPSLSTVALVAHLCSVYGDDQGSVTCGDDGDVDETTKYHPRHIALCLDRQERRALEHRQIVVSPARYPRQCPETPL